MLIQNSYYINHLSLYRYKSHHSSQDLIYANWFCVPIETNSILIFTMNQNFMFCLKLLLGFMMSECAN